MKTLQMSAPISERKSTLTNIRKSMASMAVLAKLPAPAKHYLRLPKTPRKHERKYWRQDQHCRDGASMRPVRYRLASSDIPEHALLRNRFVMFATSLPLSKTAPELNAQGMMRCWATWHKEHTHNEERGAYTEQEHTCRREGRANWH